MSTFSREIFGKRLKKQRVLMGFKRQQDLAAAVGISVQAVNYYESGTRLPDALIINKLATALNCTADYLTQLDEVASRDMVCINKRIGLSEGAISVLEHFTAESLLPNYPNQGKRAIDVVNFIIESERFDEFLDYYDKLSFVNATKYLFRAEQSTDIDTKANLVTIAAKHDSTIISNDDAIVFYLEHLATSISYAIQTGIDRKIEEGVFVYEFFNETVE